MRKRKKPTEVLIMFDIAAVFYTIFLLIAISPLAESLLSSRQQQQQQRRSNTDCFSPGIFKNGGIVHLPVSFSKTATRRLPSLLLAEQQQKSSSSDKTTTTTTTTTTTKGSGGGEGGGNEKKKESSTHRSVAIFAYMESMKKSRSATFAIRKMENDPNYLQLDQRDRAFARRILSTAERRQGQIDKVIKTFLKNKRNDSSSSSQKKKSNMNRIDPLCEATLRIGAAQLLFLDTPPYAVLSETVEVLRMHPRITVPKSKISFVNAVLRAVDREGGDVLNEQTSIFDNFEPTLIQEWIDTYGEEKTTAIMEASMEQSPIFISVNQRTGNFLDGNSRNKIQRIAQAFDYKNNNRKGDNNKPNEETGSVDGENPFVTEILPQGSIKVPKQYMGKVSLWPLYDEGDWWVQDPSATLPALALFNGLCRYGDIGSRKNDMSAASSSTKATTAATKSVADSVLQSIFASETSSRSGESEDRQASSSSPGDMHVVDLCSSPGGKTIQLCSLGFGKVTAIEVSPRRVRLLKENMQRMKMEAFCDVIVADGRQWLPDPNCNKINGVLVDAPCSATGVGARRPDVLRKSPPDLEELLVLQRELAAHAADKLLEIGGIMVYATCSLLRQESEDQVQWLLSRRSSDDDSSDDGEDDVAELETVPLLPGEIPGFDDAIDENGWLRVLPGVLPGTLSSCDGFFVARLRRIS